MQVPKVLVNAVKAVSLASKRVQEKGSQSLRSFDVLASLALIARFARLFQSLQSYLTLKQVSAANDVRAKRALRAAEGRENPFPEVAHAAVCRDFIYYI